jgi:hypothetical protein
MKSSHIALIFVFMFGISSWAVEPRTVERTLPVAGEADLDVSSGPGGVRIFAGAAGTVRVRAMIRPLAGAADLGLAELNIRALEQKPPIEQAGNRIRVGFLSDASILGRVSITYEIEAPRESRCRVVTSSGAIHVAGIAGPATLRSSSGRIEVDSASGEVVVDNSSGAVVVRRSGGRVAARTTSGHVQVLDTKGPVDVETSSGGTEIDNIAGEVKSRTNSSSIVINGAAAGVSATNHSGSIDAHGIAGEVQAQTGSGAIRISQVKPAPITARTETGAIKVDLAHQGGYELDVRSESGKVSSVAPEGAGGVVEARRVKGPFRGGGPLVHLATRSARITVN